MKVFLWKEKQFFEINKKEEIDNNTILVTDYEADMINNTLAFNGHLWREGAEIKWSGARQDDTFDWDDTKKAWVVNEERFNIKQAQEQKQAWDLIKEKRFESINGGVVVTSINKLFHSDADSINQYNQIGNMIALNMYEPIKWKLADNTWVMLTEDLFKELQLALTTNTQINYNTAENHKAEMLKVKEPLKYDYTEGWTNGIVNYNLK